MSTMVAPPPAAAVRPVTGTLPRVWIATSYNESSILNLARAAQEAGRLAGLFIPEQPPVTVDRALALPPLKGGRVEALVRRRARAVAEFPANRVRPTLFVGNLARVAVWTAGLRSPLPDGALTYAFDRAVARAIRREGRPGDVLVGMHCSSEASFRAARERGLLTVYNHVNCDMRVLNERMQTAAARLGIAASGLWPEWLLRRVDREIALADYVFSSSSWLRDDLIARGSPPSKVHILPDGVDLGRFAPEDLSAPAARVGQETPRPLRIVSVGVVSLGKGLQDLDAAIARCGPEVVERCEAIGGIVDRELVRHTPLIRYRGLLHHEEVAQALREADVFVLPSLGDTMPRVVMEALATGLPVLTTNVSGCEHIITHGENGYIVPWGDPDALAAVLRFLAACPARRRAVGAAARRTAEEWTWARHGAGFVDWLGKLPISGHFAERRFARE